jgi:hypothetical protein
MAVADIGGWQSEAEPAFAALSAGAQSKRGRRIANPPQVHNQVHNHGSQPAPHCGYRITYRSRSSGASRPSSIVTVLGLASSMVAESGARNSNVPTMR